VIHDQAYGWPIFWDKRIDFDEMRISEIENRQLGNQD
jgi:hypothetical protein